ncbi:MAG: DNA-directed RNA polymerase subunit alpha [Christensenellales bacterium]
MIEITKPNISCEENDAKNHAKFIVEPLERGFGTTLGNSMRRILLSALPGAAAVGIRIEGVDHEFSTIPGVVEDVTEIILNLKGVAVKVNSQEKDFKKAVTISKQGAGIVTAGDIKTDSEIEILNPDHYLCTMDDNGKLEMEITIGTGRGYVTAESNKDPKAPIGYIPIDSIFTPVEKVNYTVESTRVEQRIDYDKLTLDVLTNGAFCARDIVGLAAKILAEHVDLFVGLAESMSDVGILIDRPGANTQPLLDKNIEDLELSVRSYNCLKRAGIHKVSDLIQKSEDDMLKVRNLGRKSLDEVINKLEKLGLGLRSRDE